MKFRAVFRDPQVLFEACENVQSMQKYALLKLSVSKIRLSATSATIDGRSHTSNDGKICVWVSIPTATLFASMHIESKRKNEIFCLLKAADIVNALRQASSSRKISTGYEENPLSIKLSKDGNQPILLFSMATDEGSTTRGLFSMGSITHSVPVQVIGDDGPELAQLPSITECVSSFVVPTPDVLYAFCCSCHSCDERPPFAPLSSNHQQCDTVVMKIETNGASKGAACGITFSGGSESSSLRCVIQNVQLVPPSEGTSDVQTSETEKKKLFYTMKSSRLGAVMRVLCKNKRAHKTKSVFHCTKSSGIICSTNLSGDAAALYHIPCMPTPEY